MKSQMNMSPLQDVIIQACGENEGCAENSARLGGEGTTPQKERRNTPGSSNFPSKTPDKFPLIQEVHSLLQQGDRTGAAIKAGTLVKAIGVSHSGAAQYQLGTPNAQDPLVIARTPFDQDHPDKNAALRQAMDEYFTLLKLNPSPETYENAGAAGDLCLTLASSWAALLLSLRYYWESIHGSHFHGLFDVAVDNLTPRGPASFR